MTDNEKAATFIGWVDGVTCVGFSVCNSIFDGGKHCICMDCGAHALTPTGLHSHTHDIAAPDMSDPRNYMRALEGLEGDETEDKHEPQIEWGDFDGKPHGTYNGWQWRCQLVTFDDDGQIKKWIRGYGGLSIATAVNAALAALYDAEHKP